MAKFNHLLPGNYLHILGPFFKIFMFMAALVVYGSSRARDQIRALAATYIEAAAMLDPLTLCARPG